MILSEVITMKNDYFNKIETDENFIEASEYADMLAILDMMEEEDYEYYGGYGYVKADRD